MTKELNQLHFLEHFFPNHPDMNILLLISLLSEILARLTYEKICQSHVGKRFGGH